MQDTTSSAMTEVALGLSMAFFTLLIVALLSMSVPKELTHETTPEDLKHNETIDISIENNNKNKSLSSNQFAFYYQSKFYDRSLNSRKINSYSQDKALIVAVNPKLTFSEVFTLRQTINHPKLSITTSNEAWQTRLAQLVKKD
jgi:hypothetical protein